MPGAHYLFFGFGDRQYLLAKNHHAPVLLAALWPGRGMLLVTGLTAPPQEAFGAAHVAALAVTPQQLQAAQAFIRQSLDQKSGVKASARGPYDGSLYFAAAAKYSAFHTCNTWAAEVLESAALPIHSGGVLFAGQLWTQVRRAEREQTAPTTLPSARREALSYPTGQLQGGFEPSWQMTVVPEFWGTTTVVFFAGGGGLLLLMQPDSSDAARTMPDRNFIIVSS